MLAARSSTIVGLTIASAAVSPAHASPDSDPTSGRAVFTGATMPTVSSVVLDPAALVGGAIDQVYVAMTSTIDQLGITPRTLQVNCAGGPCSPALAAPIHAIVASPGADLGGIWHPRDDLAFGFEARTPPAQQWLEDQEALRYFTLGGYQREIQGSIAISLKVTGSFLFGASITVDWTLLRLRYARDTALENGDGPGGVNSDCGGGAACNAGNPAAAQTIDLKVHQKSPIGDGYIVNLGAMYELSHDVWLAVAYHTPPGGATQVQNTLDGDVTVTQPSRDGGDVLHGGATVYISEPVTVDTELRARLPRDLDLHVGGRWEDLSRELGYEVHMYGSTFFGNANVPEWTERPRGFHDVYSGWLGVEQVDAGQQWRFGARLGFETSALADHDTTPTTIAPFSGTLDVGAQLRLSSVVLQLSYGLQAFLPVHVANSGFNPQDRVDCVDGGYNYATPACASVRAGFATPTADGDYTRIEHAIRLGVRVDFP